MLGACKCMVLTIFANKTNMQVIIGSGHITNKKIPLFTDRLFVNFLVIITRPISTGCGRSNELL